MKNDLKSSEGRGMKHNVKETSIESHRINESNGHNGNERREVLKAFIELKEASIRMISIHAKIPFSNVPRSRIDLTELGLLEYVGKKPCMITGRRVEYYRVSQELRA